MEPNQDYVRVTRGVANWEFKVDSRVTETDRLPERTDEVVSRTLSVLANAVEPDKLRVSGSSVPSGIPLEDAFDEAEPLDETPITINCKEGYAVEEYKDRIGQIDIDDGRVLNVAKVETRSESVPVFLRCGFETIEDEQSRYYMPDWGDERGGPDNSPLGFSILHMPAKYGPEEKLTGHSVYRIMVGTGSDIWFNESRIGEINRARLNESLHAVDDAFSVVEYQFRVEDMKIVGEEVTTYSDPDAAAVFEYDGPSSDELIEEYRVDWVDSELVETATEYTDDGGETVFEVTSDAASVETAELRARIEAYVADQRDRGKTPQADRLRVVRTDGTTLEARFVDDGIEWVDGVEPA